MQPRLLEPLIRTYGAFRVRQLIMEIEGREPRTLDVCRLTMVDENDQEMPLKTIHNSRIDDLGWIAYAVEEYLDDLKHYMQSLDRSRQNREKGNLEGHDVEKLAEALRRLSEVSDERWARLIARERLTPHPRQRELLDIYHQRASKALGDLKTRHPEGVADQLKDVFAMTQVFDETIHGDTQDRLKTRLDDLRHVFARILGDLVLQAGPFQVFEDFGYYVRTDVHITPFQQREDGKWVNATYTIFYQDDTMRNSEFQNDGFNKLGIGSFTDLNLPEVADICGPISRWLAEKRKSHERNREWHREYAYALKPRIDDETFEALLEEAQQYDGESRDEEYHAVYDAWAALGCGNAPEEPPRYPDTYQTL